MRRMVLLLLIVSLLSAPGCWGRVEFPQAVVVGGSGMDMEADGSIITSFQLILPPGKEEKLSFTVVSSSAPTVSAGRRRLDLESPRYKIIDHIAAFVVGEAMAKDLVKMVDLMLRSPHLRENTDIFVARGSDARQVLETVPVIEKSSAQALKSMIRSQDPTTGVYAEVRIIEVLSKLAAPGIEPVIPGVEIIPDTSGKKTLRLAGTAVFKKGCLAGWLNTRESRGYRWLRPRQVRGGTLTVTCPLDGEPVSLEILRASSDITPYLENGRLKFTIKVKDDAAFYEQKCNHDLFAATMVSQLEREAERQMRADILAAVNKAQALGSDIFGLGLALSRKQPDVWQSLENDWETVFPAVPVAVEVDLKIRRSGLLTRVLHLNRMAHKGTVLRCQF